MYEALLLRFLWPQIAEYYKLDDWDLILSRSVNIYPR